jgi:DNA-binding NarL/FixJ family response regulator
MMHTDAEARILLVDDNPDFLNTLRRYLMNLRTYTILGIAQNGEDALRLTDELTPDLVVMDLVMPGIGGLQACQQIKAAYPQVRVIIMTLHNMSEYRTAAIESGADGFVPKSEVFAQLPVLIRQVMQS